MIGKVWTVVLVLALAVAAVAAGPVGGATELKSAGVMAFGPNGVLLVGDSMGASVWAFETGDTKAGAKGARVEIKGINEKIAAMLGTAADQVMLNDAVVNPVSKKVYVSVSRGRGPDAVPVMMRVDAAGKIEEVDLGKLKSSRVSLPNAPSPELKDKRGGMPRLESITEVAYLDGKVFVAGLSNEEFASNLRAIPYPFRDADRGTSIEIFHGNHGRWETNAPIRTFVPYAIKSEPHLLAAYTCTPLVKIPVSSLKPGTKVVGTTIAELGNRNRPLDMIVYQKGGAEFLLMNNNSRGVMKMPTAGIDKYDAITKQTDVTGVPYETIADLKGVEQLDKLDDGNAVILARGDGGSLDLRTIALP